MSAYIKQYRIAYTDDGGLLPNSKIISWSSMSWDNLPDALEQCDLDGWRGYVCEYPSGQRPHILIE